MGQACWAFLYIGRSGYRTQIGAVKTVTNPVRIDWRKDGMRSLFISLIFLICLVRGVSAEVLIQPSAEFSPQTVIEIQLLGLQSSAPEDIRDGKGIEQVWLFAHPNNKAVTGPLPRFRTLFDSPSYAPLVNHVTHGIEIMNLSDVSASFVVSVQGQDGKSYAYLWQLMKVDDGADVGNWMTVSVSSPRLMGDAL